MYKGYLLFYIVSEMFSNWKKKKEIKNFWIRFCFKCLFYLGLVLL